MPSHQDHTAPDVTPDMTPDRMTPAWSRTLALVRQSPLWHGAEGMERREAFIERAAQFETYEDMPADLKAIYQKAKRRLYARRDEGDVPTR